MPPVMTHPPVVGSHAIRGNEYIVSDGNASRYVAMGMDKTPITNRTLTFKYSQMAYGCVIPDDSPLF
jgi:hypothetical protein